MCADAPMFCDPTPPSKTLGQTVDDLLAERNRENEMLRRRVEDIEREYARLSRRMADID
jgi:hypothetical protein